MQLRYISTPDLIAEAGGDPWAVNNTLQAGRPAQISDLARAFHDASRCTAESAAAFEDARRRFEVSWNRVDEHPINDSAEVQRVIASLGIQSLQLPKIAVGLENVAAALAEAQHAAAMSLSRLETQLRQLDSLLGDALELEEAVELTNDLAAIDALIRELEQQAIDDTASALEQLRSQRRGYSDFLRASLTVLRTAGYDPAVLQAVDAPEAEEPEALPAPGSSAEDVNRWWKTLSTEQQSRLINDHPPELGNLNGVPVDIRSRVNEAVMNDDLRRVQDLATQNGVTVSEALRDPGRYALTGVAVIRYSNACRTRQGLEGAASGHAPVFLLKYMPEAFAGDGAAAIAIGNPDTAANTAVLVKGAGTGLREGSAAKPDAVRIYQESSRADWGKGTAVVLWLGYDAPDGWDDPGLREPGLARVGAQTLAADVNALAVTHQGAPTHMTVLGHSYGSTVVSDAAAGYGMRANDVVVVGSPGTDLAHSAADFHLSRGGHLYVGAASGDVVTWTPGQVTGPGLFGPSFGGLGDDPSVDGYGSTRFKAEVPAMDPIGDHLHYFDDGSESLFSIGDVVSGHGDALQHDGMTARHRGEYGLGGWFDPEAARPATGGHRHRAPER
jgi:DNA-directed RNA polymerase subunit H (RpoH/RPB5)